MHDPRLTWNTIDIVRRCGGEPVLCKSGHAFIKQKMREVDGVYGGEMSAHHYFREFSYCDSGMIPWLLVLQVICERGLSLARAGRRAHAAVSGQRRDQPAPEDRREIHPRARPAALRVRRRRRIDFTDGLSMEFPEWRFNLRGSNTEPLVRLNVESRGSEALMREKTAEILQLDRRLSGRTYLARTARAAVSSQGTKSCSERRPMLRTAGDRLGGQ